MGASVGQPPLHLANDEIVEASGDAQVVRRGVELAERAGIHHVEQHRVLEREGARRAKERHHIGSGIVGDGDTVEPGGEQLEAFVEDGSNEAGLVTEELVERAGRCAGGGGDAPGPQRDRPFVLEDSDRLTEQVLPQVCGAQLSPGHTLRVPYRNDVSEQCVNCTPTLEGLVVGRSAYDDIGIGYARHRRPDPRFQAAIHAALGAARTVLNLGAGTGSYEPTDRCVLAVEPSLEMIMQRPPGSAPCLQGTAESLGFADDVIEIIFQGNFHDVILLRSRKKING